VRRPNLPSARSAFVKVNGFMASLPPQRAFQPLTRGPPPRHCSSEQHPVGIGRPFLRTPKTPARKRSPLRASELLAPGLASRSMRLAVRPPGPPMVRRGFVRTAADLVHRARTPGADGSRPGKPSK
jgi:hypothetical protein